MKKLFLKFVDWFDSVVKSYSTYGFHIEGKYKDKMSKFLDENEYYYEIYLSQEFKEGYLFKFNGRFISGKDYELIMKKLRSFKIKFIELN
jgi:hypothetical protein